MQKEVKQMVVSDPKVMMGKPVIAGTRITVELILEKLAEQRIFGTNPRLPSSANSRGDSGGIGIWR